MRLSKHVELRVSRMDLWLFYIWHVFHPPALNQLTHSITEPVTELPSRTFQWLASWVENERVLQ